MSAVKEYLFGSSSFRITKKRAEEFFSTERNFTI